MDTLFSCGALADIRRRLSRMQPAAACKIGPDERAVLAHRQHANGVQVLRSTAHQNGSELEKRMKNGTEWTVLLIQMRKT
jgi:two-component sensor histidine kinase